MLQLFCEFIDDNDRLVFYSLKKMMDAILVMMTLFAFSLVNILLKT